MKKSCVAKNISLTVLITLHVKMIFGTMLFDSKKHHDATVIAKTRHVDDYIELQQAIDEAYKGGRVLTLKQNKKYKITKPLNIRCSINGNNASIEPIFHGTRALHFSEDNLIVKNLRIEGSRLSMIDISSDDLIFDNCHFEGHAYFVLLLISGNNCKILNSTIKNHFKGRHQFAIKSKDNTSPKNLVVENSAIYGGIYIANSAPKEVGGHVFKDNVIEVDYTHAKQDFYTQHDGFRFRGIKGIDILDNTITFKNVNRGFKFTDYDTEKKLKRVSKFPTTDVNIKGNTIKSNSSNGKQLFDMFDGTAVINIINNEIHSYGHTTLFEDKTTYKLPSLRHLTIKSNRIFFDYRILYYRGNPDEHTKQSKISLTIMDNDFFYTPGQFADNMSRQGSENTIELQYVFYVRNITDFTFLNNRLWSSSIAYPFKGKYVLYLYEVNNTLAENNQINGGILCQRRDSDYLIFRNNTIENIALSNLIHFRFPQKIKSDQRIRVENNTVNHSNLKFKISNIALKTDLENKINLIR